MVLQEDVDSRILSFGKLEIKPCALARAHAKSFSLFRVPKRLANINRTIIHGRMAFVQIKSGRSRVLVNNWWTYVFLLSDVYSPHKRK